MGEYYHIVLFLLAIAIAVSTMAPKLKMPFPVLLMLTGIILGLIPNFHYVPINPDIVFLLFLPPMLYNSAINIPFHDFKKNIGTISALAVTMVFITMTAIAVIVYYFIPDMSWPVAFVIGAILSPPDAIAASATLDGMNIPRRTKVIIEGESLVNDASALTAYRIALGVVTGSAFVLWQSGLLFIFTILGGIIIGLVMGWAFVMLLRVIPFTCTASVCLNILLPFVAYQLAESLSVSGVLAVVILGLFISRAVDRRQVFSKLAAIQAKSTWSVIIYMLNGLIFIMIGLEFPQVFEYIPSGSILPLMLSSLLIFIVALLVRVLFIFIHIFHADRKALIRQERDKTKHYRIFNNRERIEIVRAFDWKNALVIGWTGMRGIVSVAAAIALPVVFADGTVFYGRSEIIFLTVMVVVLMLFIQGMGLPLLIKKLKIGSNTDKIKI